MATQKQEEKQGNGGRGQPQAITVQRGSQDRQLAREAMPTARRMARSSPFSIMRRMLDDFDDLGTLSSPLGLASPFSTMRRMFDDMERMFESTALPEVALAPRDLAWTPPIEIVQRGDILLVRAEIPGVAKDQVRVTTDNDRLVIEGERALASDQQEDVWCSECAHGKFRRVVALPEGAETAKVEARFENGILEVSVPVPQLMGRRIEIQTAGTGTVQPPPQLEKGTAQPPKQTEKH